MIRTTILISLVVSGAVWGQSAAPVPSPAAKPAVAAAPVRYLPALSRRAQMFYEGVWGVDDLSVKWAESGEIVRFSYHVLDPQKAAPLNDKKLEPSFIDPQAGVSLVIPQVQNVGMLRQAPSTTEAGKSYWMAFSNVGRRVKKGDRVDVKIGNFRAQGLVVE
jgi:hypothetical protein